MVPNLIEKSYKVYTGSFCRTKFIRSPFETKDLLSNDQKVCKEEGARGPGVARDGGERRMGAVTPGEPKKWQRSRNNVRDQHRLPDASMRGPAIRPEPRRLGEDGYPGRNAGARRVAPCMSFPQFWRTCPPFRYVVCASAGCLRVL